jgi:Predicted ATPase (AAA+ superfamily)
MYVERNNYLKQLIDRKQNGLIKTITGIRRCGKSFLLFRIYHDYLLSIGVKESNIIQIALDSFENRELLDIQKLYDYINARIANSKEEYYIFLDEIQFLITPDELRDKTKPVKLYSLLNSFLRLGNVDVYVTGSNSRMLSSDIRTEFRGRSDEVRVHPLSFKELYQAMGMEKETLLNQYLIYGGLPLVWEKTNLEAKQLYLKTLCSDTYIRDVVERNNIDREDILDELTDVLASSTGSLTNTARLANSINSMQNAKLANRVSNPTIKAYIDYLKDAFLVTEAKRYDIKGKRYFEYQNKYYFTDVGIRNTRLNFRQIEYTHIMENIIFNRLTELGCSVDIGMVTHNGKINGKSVRQSNEIDFVVNKGNCQYYIQSAFGIDSEEKIKQELKPFSMVNNSFRKIVVTRYELMPHYDENGIFHIGLADFLLDEGNALS